MAVSSVRLFARLITNTSYKQNNVLFYQNSHTQKLLFHPILLPSMVFTTKRMASFKRKPSKFPQNDIIQRNEELMKKLNPMDERLTRKDIPSDHGYRADSSGQIFSSFIPKTDKSAKNLWESTKAKISSTYAVAMIKRKDTKPFKVIEFAKSAQKKFIDLNNDLQLPRNKNIELRMEEKATLDVLSALEKQFGNPGKKVYWRYVKELERPRVVNAAVGQPPGDNDNVYAQVTVRMCTEQILAIQDRYDRLVLGSLKRPKRVIDYVVFERHLSDTYGNWRICGKINAL